MATDTKIRGDVKMPVGTYPSTRNGQAVTSKRHREIGVLMEMTYDSGNTQMVVKLNVEILSIEMQALLRANKILKEGDDAIMCPVYPREPRGAANGGAAAPAAAESDNGYSPEGPF